MQMTNLAVVFDLKNGATVILAASRADFVRGLIRITAFAAKQMPQRQ
jgi:hypothetical protein